MVARWLLVLLLVPLLSSIAFSQKLIDGFTREFAIQGLPVGFSLKSFDVTGDSVSELFVLTTNQLWVFDGKTFSMIFKDSAAPGTANLSSVDVNQDGTADLVASSSDTAVVVWHGPDLLNRSVFQTPITGFISFGARSIQGGMVEFLFGFAYEHCESLWYCLNPPGLQCETGGYVLRYKDTTFVFSDSTHLNSGISNIGKVEILDDSLEQFLLVEYESYFRYSPTIRYNSLQHSGVRCGSVSLSSLWNSNFEICRSWQYRFGFGQRISMVCGQREFLPCVLSLKVGV